MKRLVILVLCLCGLISSSAFGQFDSQQDEFLHTKGMSVFTLKVPSVLNFSGAGSRAMAMGGAFLALSDDVSAISWNPAGLYGQEKPVLGFSFGSYAPKGTYDMNAFATIQAQSSELSESFAGVSLLSFTAPVRIKGHPFVVAASYSRAGDEYNYQSVRNIYTTEELKPDGTMGNVYFDENYTGDYISKLDVVNFGFGTRVTSQMSAGASVNIYTNKSISMQGIFISIDSLYVDNQPQTLNQDLSMLDTSWYSGVNFTLGWKYSADKFSLGAVIKSPFSLQHKTNRTFHQITWVNGLEQGDAVVHFDRVLTKIELPLTVGVGGAFHATDDLVMAADLEYRRFSGCEIKLRERFEIVPGEKDIEEFSVHDPQWEDVIAVRLGAEYTWETGFSAFPTVPVRMGFSYVPIPAVALYDSYGYIPIPDPEELNLEWDDIKSDEKSNIISFSAGAGVKWSQIYVDLVYIYSTVERDYGLLDATTKVDASNFGLTFTGYF